MPNFIKEIAEKAFGEKKIFVIMHWAPSGLKMTFIKPEDLNTCIFHEDYIELKDAYLVTEDKLKLSGSAYIPYSAVLNFFVLSPVLSV